jgi:hypothetical protein
MNRTLKRPMFRIGGSAGTGITSGLDQPQKMANGGRTGYQQGSMPSFQTSGLPGFLTSFGLNLLATPPAGNIFQTAGIAAREPFNQLQVSQARANELRGERDFLRGETDRKIAAKSEETDKLIASREKIASMQDVDANVMAYAEVFKDNNGSPNLIKGQNAVDFFNTKYNELTADYGVESVSVEPIDITLYQSQQNIKKFRKANPGAEGKVYFDVASGKGVKLVKDVETGDLKFIPADSSDIDTTGEDMPAPNENEIKVKPKFEDTFKSGTGLTSTDQFIIDTINENSEKIKKGMEEVPNFNIYR